MGEISRCEKVLVFPRGGNRSSAQSFPCQNVSHLETTGYSADSGWGLRAYISDKLPGDNDAAGWRTTLQVEGLTGEHLCVSRTH